MDSHAPPPPPYSMPLRHPGLPPVPAAVGMPPLQPHVPRAHHVQHVVHAHAAHHLPHTLLPQPVALSSISIPLGAHLSAPSPYYEQYTSERFARLTAENEKLRRENEALRAKLTDLDRDRAKCEAPKVQSRYWTQDEHQRFLEALSEFGAKDVRAIASYVGTRNATQVRTHAQKYFLRKQREAKGGLQSARKRSMSESDLVRMGRPAPTPPGSPVKREHTRVAQLRAAAGVAAGFAASSGDVRMADVPSMPGMPSRHARASGLASPLSTSVISIPSMVLSAQPPPPPQTLPPFPRDGAPGLGNGGRPPAAPFKVSDNSGINLLSMVATEHEIHPVRSRN